MLDVGDFEHGYAVDRGWGRHIVGVYVGKSQMASD